MNGIFAIGLVMTAQTLGPVEQVNTTEYGLVYGQKILDGPQAGLYNIVQSQAISQVGGAEQQFLNLVNNWRASQGLPALGWDQNLANAASTNNAVHAPHSIVGAQVWAGATDFASSFYLWINSPPHAQILRSARSAIGVAKCLTGCTANTY